MNFTLAIISWQH